MTERRHLRRTLAVAASTALLLAGCSDGADGEGDASGCREAVADAAEATNMPERNERLEPAFDACQNLADFGAAVAESPEALEGVDVEQYVRERCRESDTLRDANLCQAFG